jgi:translation initiation factor 6
LEVTALPLKALDLNGDPYLGVFAEATETHVFVPLGVQKHALQAIEEALGVPHLTLTVGGTRVIGTLVAANSKGAVIGDIALEEELREVRAAGLEVFRLGGRFNAAGNVVLASERAAMVHPRLSRGDMQGIADALDVEVERGTVAGLYTVGSAAVATVRGVLAHPKVDDEEIAQLKDLFGVEVGIGTINYGTPMIGSGVLANSKGACFGTASTGIEKGRVAEALGLL